MAAYASRTGTRRNMAAISAAGWGVLLSAAPDASWHIPADWPNGIMLDNGAFTCWQRGLAPDWSRFARLVEARGADADFVVAPDVVCGGLESLALSVLWLPQLLDRTPGVMLVPAQNGMEPCDVESVVVPGRVGVFIGGDDEWKERAALTWGPWCAARRIHCHVGRVNTARRIAVCSAGSIASFDGSSASRYSKTLGELDAARRDPAAVQTDAFYSPKVYRRSGRRARSAA